MQDGAKTHKGQRKYKNPPLDERITFRTDDTTLNKLKLDSTRNGVSVSSQINRMLNPVFWQCPHLDVPPVGVNLIVCLRDKDTYIGEVLITQVEWLEEEWGEAYTTDGGEVLYWAFIPDIPR